MVKDSKGEYDLDYQIEITKNSYEYKNDNLNFRDAGKIKNDFIEAFKHYVKGEEVIEDSTTAITLINEDNAKRYHVDFVIVCNFDDSLKIIRKDKETGDYFWNEVRHRNDEIYSKFKLLSPPEKKELVDKIIQKKCEEKPKSNGKSSYEIFLSMVGDHLSKNNRKS